MIADVVTELGVRIQRRSDATVAWEGRAQLEADAAHKSQLQLEHSPLPGRQGAEDVPQCLLADGRVRRLVGRDLGVDDTLVRRALDPTAADDRTLVFELSERVRDTIQQKVYDNLVERGPAFL